MTVNDIKTEPKYIAGVNFDYTKEDDKKGFGPHIAYTTSGAASLMDEAYLFKALDVEVSKNINNKENTDVSEVTLKALQDELAAEKMKNKDLKVEIKAKEITKSLETYKFTDEIGKALSDVMVILSDEQVKGITDAFDVLKTATDIAVEKAKGNEENPLKKALDEEVGESSTGNEVEKTLVDEIREASKLV